MSLFNKPEYPPLLPDGLHVLSLRDVLDLCVTRLAASETRRGIGNGLARLVEMLENASVSCDLWVDGSFMTEKLNPKDVDIVVHVMGDTFDSGTVSQRELLLAIKDQEFFDDLFCDSYVVPHCPGDVLAERTVAYWRDWFGLSRASYEKGMGVLKICGGMP